jgi:hypothetical protein
VGAVYVKRLIFSRSASVEALPEYSKLDEH